jgi:CHASE3 domain sensor protein
VVPVEQVAEEAGTWAASLGEEEREARLGELFATILQQVNRERGEVIAGIGRYAGRQESYSQEIDALQQELADLEAVPEADRNWDRVEELQDRLVWETRIYRDRAQSLTYVCETPVLLEQRAFAIARALAGLI